MIKKLTVLNHIDAAHVTEFNGVDAGTTFERRVKAAAKHFSIEIPENYDFCKKGNFILGNENDLYCISVTDADKNETAQNPEPTEISKATFEIEFTDTEEKGILLDLLRQAVCDVTGAEMKGQILSGFEAFINKNESLINSIAGQNKVNTFAIPQDINAQLIAQDIADGLRPALKAKRVRTKKV